jgi:hypothetical protein
METTTKVVNRSEAEVQERPEEKPLAEGPSDTTPQEFYVEITRRADVREILEELAAG